MKIDINAFEHAVSIIDDGWIFEKFGTEFLSAVLDYSFIPVGGTKDKGVDGYQHIFYREKQFKQIFQLSIEKDPINKIFSTIKKLRENKVNFERLVYVTNRKINNAEKLTDEVYEKENVVLIIYDIRWFCSNCNHNHKTIKTYQIFVETYLHEYSKPGKYVTVADFDSDSRLYVFLGQQFEVYRDNLKLDDLLADSLILYALEGTDPEKQIFKSEVEIKTSIKGHLQFDPKLLESKISERLAVLSKSPIRIQYHRKFLGYCLPYETRSEISTRNLQDEALLCDFFNQTKITVKKYFTEMDVKVKDIENLIVLVFKKIFSKQGLEFSDFVLRGDSQSVIEQNLHEVVAMAVDESSIIVSNKEKVKTSLHLAIRDIVYNGSQEQQKFLKSLSNTYLMMFLLQWEPKLCTYFQALTSKLQIFVDNSIIIPAMSENYLIESNKRHWNLLIGAKKAGISMFINETLLDELVSHLKMVRNKYYNYFYEQEEFYLNDEFELLYIDEILIRAYFYAKKKGHVRKFDTFLDYFVDPDLRNAKDQLVTFLNEVFGIKYVSNEQLSLQINEKDKEKLTEVLSERKDNEIKAKNDAEMILAIYYLRKTNGESSDSGVFGYKTWWLSKDTSTYKAVVKCFGSEKYPVSCYIRPDFVYNYIALQPTVEEVEDAYDQIFPTMLGVNLSYHMPKEVSLAVQEKIKEYRLKAPVRIKQTLHLLSDKLKTDPSIKNKKAVELFLDEELSKIADM